ncbi:uncharacterized protein LOC123678729 [Harmonia axyridis]|uniref:uncharacterized protein LOC123678729 n=1 Tax=Harmonia axyridis TaxID=115357 RepID=UPI001E2751A3|nr:uncharacterized protein LOC123678729 [Harmonia axyridis]
MAKKGQTAQLQTELGTDEEWEKYLQKPGLLVIDVYSDWCGPCTAMQANLKKLKVEIGGDTLQLAVAKCDGITALERFRGTSEPTWMLVSEGKMVNFLYGANAPKLSQVITDELRLQKMVEEGSYTREEVLEVTDRAPDEAKRWELIQSKLAEEEALEEKKRAEEVHQRLLKESDAILENLGNLGVMVVLPHARDKYLDVMKDLMNEAGLVISISEKAKLTSEQIQGVSYFLEEDQNLFLPEKSLEHMFAGGDSQIMVVKASHGTADREDPVSVRVLEVVYGNMKQPPGDPDCPYQKLIKYPSVENVLSSPALASTSQVLEDQMADASKSKSAMAQPPPPPAPEPEKSLDEGSEEEGSEAEIENYLIGIWAPPTRRILSSCFKILFPRMAAPILIPEPPPKPPYISVCYPIDKRSKIQDMIQEWETEIERYGIFTSFVPEEAQLVAKSFKKFDKADVPKTGEEKIVIQLARRRSECLLSFACEIPAYMSPNVHQGKRECKIFFPEGYDEPPEMEEEGEEEDEEEGEFDEESMAVEFEENKIVDDAGMLEDVPAPDEASMMDDTEATEASVEPEAPTEEASIDVTLTRDIMEEILYFSDQKAEHLIFEENPKKPTLGVTLKRSSENLPGNVIDDVVLQVVYGNSRKHPGDEGSPSKKFLKVDPDDRTFIGLWAPPNTRCKAMAIKLLFPSLGKAYKLPEFEHVPLHVVMAYDAFKTNDLMELSKQHPGGVMRFGFFDSDQPAEAKLIAKTVEEFETRSVPVNFEEKIILQISKENKECFTAFLDIGPSYRSINVEIGEKDSSLIFPPGYDAPLKQEREVSKKSKKKKTKIVQQVTVNKEGEEVIETLITDQTEEIDEQKTNSKEDGDENGDEEYDEEEEEINIDTEDAETVAGEEKATSPMTE